MVAACNCCRFSVPTRHGQHVLPEVLHISTPSHLVPWVLLPHTAIAQGCTGEQASVELGLSFHR